MARERLLTFREAGAWLEEETGLKRSAATLWGWHYYGRKGVKLEAVSVAGIWHTSAEAVKRFLSNVTRQHARDQGITPNELVLLGEAPGAG